MTKQKLLEVARRSPLFKSIGDRSLRKILEHFHIYHLDKGEYLFRADQKSRVMYIVAEGKLRVEKIAAAAPTRPMESQIVKIASLTAGDIVGEVAMLTGERHSGQVRAMTDAALVGIGKDDLSPLLRHYPRLLQNLTRIEAMRLRHNIVRETKAVKELGFILHLYFTTPADFLAAEAHTTAAIAEQKLRSFMVLEKKFLREVEGDAAKTRLGISKILLKVPSVYLPVSAADFSAPVLTALVQMADRLVITLSEDANSVHAAEDFIRQRQVKSRIALLSPYAVTVHHPSRENLLIPDIEKLIRMGVKYRLKLHRDYWESDDHRHVEIQCITVARSITDTNQGIAFGGGGARALSEIGVISELERLGIDFDHVSGTSMGALIAAFYAQGLSSREMSERFREFLPSDKGLLRYNLPFISFFSDRSVNRILRRLFRNTRIEDLPKPLTIIAADLISGQEIRMQKGLLWRAIRASMSLPVIFPPVKYHRYYLVDGGAINNVPGNALRDHGVGSVLGINCTPLEDDAIKEYLASTNLFQLLKPGDKFLRNLKRFFKLLRIFFTRPPILQIANRAMMLEGSELIRQKSDEFDLLLSPDVARFGLFEFDRREEIIDVGRSYARAHAGDLKKLFRKS